MIHHAVTHVEKAILASNSEFSRNRVQGEITGYDFLHSVWPANKLPWGGRKVTDEDET
jgi:hypothetical protein